MNAKRSVLFLPLWAVLLLGGCPVEPGTDVLSGKRSPSWLDGDWLLDYSNSPNPTVLTFTDGKVTSELAGGFEPVAVLWAMTATIDGNEVSWSYGSRQTGLLLDEIISSEGSATFSGTIQDDGSLSGTLTLSGTLNGIPANNTVGFIMRRL